MTNAGEVLRSLLPPDGATSLRLPFMCLGTLLQSDRKYVRAAEMRWTTSAVRYGEEFSYGGVQGRCAAPPHGKETTQAVGSRVYAWMFYHSDVLDLNFY